MDLSRPYTAVAPTLDGVVLMVLAGTHRPLTGREVARLARVGSQAGINLSLRRLVAHGIIQSEEAGSAFLYQLNRAHLAAYAVKLLATMRTRFLARLRDEIVSWKIKPVHASLFGSAARGDGDVTSDIDLLVVRPRGVPEEHAAWRGQLRRLERRVRQWTGNRLSLAEISQAELRRLRVSRPPIAASLEQEGRVIFGPRVLQRRARWS